MSDSSISTNSSRDGDRQIDDLKSAHEKKLAQLRAQQQKEESAVRETGEAAVNHIRKSTDDRVEQAKADSEARLEREGDSVSKNYSSLKKRALEQNQTTEKEIALSREHADENIASNKQREERAIEQTQVKLKDFLAKQRDLRASTERKSADEIHDEEKHNNEVRRKVQTDNDRELRTLDNDHKERLHELTQENNSTYEDAKTQAQNRFTQLRRDDDVKLKHERDQDNEAFTRVHQKSHDDIQKQQQLGQAGLSSTISENQHKLEDARAKALTTNEKVQHEYSKEAERVEREGKKDIDARQTKFNKLVIKEKTQEKEEINDLKADHQAELKDVEVQGEGKIQEEVTKLRDVLHNKVDQFQKEFVAEDSANKSSLNNQKEMYLKEQYKQKRAHESALDVIESRKFDSFYQPKSFDASITEHEDKYILQAKVPAYEKDNVEVRVKDGKVTLSSARQYKNQMKDTDGSKVETNGAQTYRQEFTLAKPADTKRVMTQVKDDGSILAIIPKKGFAKL